MELSVMKTVRITPEEVANICTASERYEERGRDDLFDRWMRRRYGYAEFLISRQLVQGRYELALGRWVK